MTSLLPEPFAPQQNRSENEVYRSKFGNWDQRASVRVKASRRLDLDAAEPRCYFPPELAPEASHPQTLASGPAAERDVLLHRLYGYLDFTSELESALVIPVASSLARGRAGVAIPDAMRADAYNIVTDEAWHAQFTDDLLRQLVDYSGVGIGAGAPAFFSRLDSIRATTDVSLGTAVPLAFAICSETLISNLLATLPHDTRLLPAVRDTVRDHAEDEGRHNAYFRAVLDRFWAALTAPERRVIGHLLPQAIIAFLEPDYAAIQRGLVLAGLEPSAAHRVVVESYPPEKVRSTCRDGAASTLRYLAGVGAFDDAYIRENFESSGLLDDQIGL
mgnify:CR=1 FL=1